MACTDQLENFPQFSCSPVDSSNASQNLWKQIMELCERGQRHVEWLQSCCDLPSVTIHLSMRGNALYVLFWNKISTFRLDVLTGYSDNTSGGVVILGNRQNLLIYYIYINSKNALFHAFVMKYVKSGIGSHKNKNFRARIISVFHSFLQPRRLWLVVALMWLHTSATNNKLCHQVKWTCMGGRYILSKVCRLWKGCSTQGFKLRTKTNDVSNSET